MTEHVRNPYKFGDRVMLLEDFLAAKAGTVLSYIKPFVQCDVVVRDEDDHKFIVPDSKLVKCGHCESCKRYYYAEHCGHVFQKGDMYLDCPDWTSCTDGWELCPEWAKMEIEEYTAGKEKA